MPDADVVALQNAVIKLNGAKVSHSELTALNDLHVARYIDLKNQIVALTQKVEALQQWVVNHITGNAI